MRSGRPSGARLRRAPAVSGPCSYPSCSTEDLVMRTYDFTPLWRSTIGFDRFFDLVDAAQHEFLYQGISSRPFKRQFNLADYVQVKGAAFDNGLLQIELVREIPEAM